MILFTKTADAAGRVSSLQFSRHFTFLIALLALFSGSPARAEDRDGEFLRIFGIIQEGDTLDQSGQTEAALAKYRRAQIALQAFKKSYPDWNTKMVSFRANYLAGKVAGLSEKLAPASEANAAGTNATAKSAASSGPPGARQVKLLGPGAEPRRVLRLHPKAGDKHTMTITLIMSMEMSAGELKNPPMKFPGIAMVMDLNVKNVSPNGDIAYETVTTDASLTEEEGVMPEIAQSLKTSVSSLKGASGKATISDRGILRNADFQLAGGAAPSARQTLDQMRDALANVNAPLPEEAVGPGAKWEVRTPIKSQGMNIDQTATYELVSLEEDRVTAKTTIAQRAANQKISSPAMPGVKLDLTKMTGTGSGETTLDLAQLAPKTVAAESHSELSMAMNTGGQKQAMTVKIDVKIRVEGK